MVGGMTRVTVKGICLPTCKRSNQKIGMRNAASKGVTKLCDDLIGPCTDGSQGAYNKQAKRKRR